MSQFDGLFQIPGEYLVDRAFASSASVALAVAALELWLIRGVGKLHDIDHALVTCHFTQGSFSYIVREVAPEAPDRLHHRLEWLCITEVERVITWSDIEVA